MKSIGIIPVRMDSSRYPGKPLKKICGIPMVTHVYERTKRSKKLNDVFIATCDKEIFNYASSIGAKVIMTSKKHQRASDRIAEALKKIEKIKGEKIKNIIMIQGDEPLVDPEMINESILHLNSNDNTKVTNIYTNIKKESDWKNKNIVKVVNDSESNAIYFSREAIPSTKKFSSAIMAKRQICVIGFTNESLNLFQKIKPTKLEIIESIDMNRLIENGYKVKMIFTNKDPFPVDTYEDLKKIEKIMVKDSLFKKYKEIYV